MVNYRRNKIQGGTYFFTVTLNDRSSQLLINEIDLLREAMQKVKKENPYSIIAIVILPEHIHTIWSLLDDDNNFAGCWRKIKRYFSQGLIAKGYLFQKNQHSEYPIWQRRFWEHSIRDQNDLDNHINYIHYNPVKHGLVKNVSDWEYSSFHQYVRNGLLPNDWGADIDQNNRTNFGE